MKLFVVAAVLGVAAAGRLDNTYLPPRGGGGFGGQGGSAGGFGHSGSSGFGAKSSGFNSGSYGQSAGGFNQGSGAFNQGGGAFGQASGGFNQGAQTYNAPAQTYNARPQSSFEASAQILKYDSDVTADGFSYDFETSNGIRADARGVATNGVQSQGSFGYKGDDGQDYSITYTADENGYRPQGAHLPTPPPIPEEILKSLEQNARDEAAGIVDDGQYRGEGAGHGGAGHSGAGGYGGGAGFGQGSGQGFGQGSGQFGGNSGGFQAKAAQGAGSNRYLPPNAGPARNSGSFNQNSGYQY